MRYLYIYMIKKNVSIKIESSHDQIAVTEEARGSRIVDETELETDSEKFEMTTEGILRVVDGRIEIEYFETEITGMAGACTCLSFEYKNPGVVSLLRTGVVESALVFEEGVRHVCVYTTPELAFEVCVNTAKVVNNITTNGGELFLNYTIEFRGAEKESTFIHIAITQIDVPVKKSDIDTVEELISSVFLNNGENGDHGGVDPSSVVFDADEPEDE